MYNESYEDYIRSILGYPNYNNSFENDYNYYKPVNYRNTDQLSELENYYPEIYKIVYPMIRNTCMNNTENVTEELIDKLSDEIYSALENNNEINLSINLTNDVPSNRNRSTSSNVNKKEATVESRGEDRQFRNRGLQDLIRILLIREFLGNSGRFLGNRPPMPPPNRPPMRPPFPGGPGPRPQRPMM